MKGEKDKIEIKRDELGQVVVSSTELRKNFGAYMKLVEKEDFYVTRRGKETIRFQDYNRYL